ncbi:MAG TPA: tetratricopeptide repeat protein [Blastocatellia bacterium]|nr:tetratricopeptide repeat protein [Blastocatellia bacterium]
MFEWVLRKRFIRHRLLTATILICAGTSCVVDVSSYAASSEPVDSRSKLVSETLKRAEELRRRWSLEAANAAFREAADLEPANLEAVLGLARVARARLEYAQAIRLLDQAASQHSATLEILAEYGSVYLAAEEPERARRYFETALQISPSYVSGIVGLAGVDLLERNYEKATVSLRDLLVREPNTSSVLAMLARVLLESSRNAEAAEEARRAMALDPYNTEALHALACVKSIERNAGEARSLVWRVVSLDSFNIGARRMLSQYLDGQAGYDQKVSEAARTHYQRARSLKQGGDFAKATPEFEAALDIEPRYYRALIGLGDLCLREGNYERAAAVARLAIAVDPEGSSGHLELSCAYRGLNERARSEIGGVNFAESFHSQRAPSVYAKTREIFPDYASLTKRQQEVIDYSVAPLSQFLQRLARHKARHYLLPLDERPGDLPGFADVADEKTFDGRYYASIRGVGGRIAVTGIEYLDQAARGGFNTIAHEFAHQVHIAGLSKSEVKTIRNLYEQARREGRTLDYYAAANEYEYFAQGYEAFISMRKRPSAGVTARHTSQELFAKDPQLYRLLMKLCGRQ